MTQLKSVLFVPVARFDSYIARLRREPRDSHAVPDAMVLDLEDSVPDQEKDSHREQLSCHLGNWLSQVHEQRSMLFVRINDRRSKHHEADLALLQDNLNAGVCIKLPKVEDPHDLDEVTAMFSEDNRPFAVIPTIETLEGYGRREEILRKCHSAGHTIFSFGAGDMALDANVDRDRGVDLLNHIARDLIISGRRLGLHMLHTPSRCIPGTRGRQSWQTKVELEAQWATDNGCVGKHAIHPDQVPIINRIFEQAEKSDRERADSIVSDFEHHPDTRSTVSSYSGQYIGLPSLKWAKSRLSRGRKEKE